MYLRYFYFLVITYTHAKYHRIVVYNNVKGIVPYHIGYSIPINLIFKKKGFKMEIVNCTPHSLNVKAADGSFKKIDPSGICPRVTVKTVLRDTVNGIEIFDTEMGDVTGLPKIEADTIYVVSLAVKSALSDKYPKGTFVSPGTLIRGEDGQPIGCNGLAC